MQLPYDKSDPTSILEYAKKLLNRSLRQVLGDHIQNVRKGKGGFGEFIEKAYFLYEPNSISQPDFPSAGLELKTTPVKNVRQGIVAKERLVFNMIDYIKEHQVSFYESSFWKKNSFLLLMFYQYEPDKLDIDFTFKIIRLWRFPEEDLKIIKDDWNKIINKIKAGKAHELSESDTLYLGACTKGASKESVRSQPFSNIPAKRRAYSLKPQYINYIIRQSLGAGLPSRNLLTSVEEESPKYINKGLTNKAKLDIFNDAEPIIKNPNEIDEKQSFEDLIISKLSVYVGKSESELISFFNLEVNAKAKNRFDVITRAMLGVRKKKIEEFEKANVLLKTIRVEDNGTIKESMSFRQIQYNEIMHQEWEDSDWYGELNRRFFFVVFRADKNGNYLLQNSKFWSIPNEDMEILNEVWLDTKRKIHAGDFDSFIKASDERIGHVRPKARDSDDLMQAPNGTMQKKKCFWLNSSYIKKIIQESNIN